MDLCPPDRRQELTDMSHASDLGFIGRQEFIEGAGELTGKTQDDIERIIARVHLRNEGLLADVARLKVQFQTGLLSNMGSDSIGRLFTATELAQLFDAVVLSSDEGMAKPEVRIFELAAARLGCRPEECVMIDDSPRNLEGAQQAGMQTILYTTRRECLERLGRLTETSL